MSEIRLIPQRWRDEPQEWSDEQREVLAHERGARLVLGGPGTGKTALLVALAARAGRPPLVIALSRQAASEVRDRVVRLAGRTAEQPNVMTVHALCLSLLQRYCDPEELPALLAAPEQELRLRELLAGWGASAWPEELGAATTTASFARQVRAVLARARQLGLDADDVEQFGREAGEPSWAALGRFMEEYLEVLDLEQVIDYAELVHRARLLLEDPAVADAVRSQFGMVLVDEVAELDPAQLALVRVLAGANVVGFADPDTAIYRFRGAHPRATAEFVRLFDAEVTVLSRSFRVPEAVGAGLARVAGRLGVPALDADVTARYRAWTGRASVPEALEVLTYQTEQAELREVAALVRAAHLDDGVPWGELAVLVRAGRTQIPPLVRALTDAGIPVDVAGDEIGLADDPAVRPLLLALAIAGRGTAPTEAEASELLTSGWGGLDALALRVAGRALKGEQVGPGAAVAAVLAGGPVPEDLPQGAQDAVATIAARAVLLAEASEAVARGERAEEVLWRLWQGTPWPQQLREGALGGGDLAPAAHHALDAVCALFALGAESPAKGGPRGVETFLEEVAGQHIPADDERESAVGGGVRVLTAHRAKGREWRRVVVAGVQEGVWPDVRKRGALFDPQRLGSEGLGEGVTVRDLVATERRLFLLACSRASERVVVTAVATTEGEAMQPSRFVTELGVEPRPVTVAPARLHTLRDLVGSLRRTAVDPEASPELRSAACARLARLADEVDAQGRPLVPAADPGRWWGVREWSTPTVVPREGELRLSPSQLDALVTCPRRYFLDRRAKSEPAKSPAMVLGSVLHALAEHIVTEGLSRDEALARLDEVWEQVPFQTAWQPVVERVEAELAVDRLLAWQAERSAEVVGVEVPFSFTVEVEGHTVTIAGTVDRLERDATGALHVLDFKTSRADVKRADVDAHAQLGVYQWAIEEGAFEAVAPGASRSAGGSLVMLRQGDALPKVLHQKSLRERPRLDDSVSEHTWVYDLVADAAATLASGEWPATPGEGCRGCAFVSSCPAKEDQVIA